MHLDTASSAPHAAAPPRDVARALAFIDAHACDPELCASGVQDALGLRASGFRTRFRQATGHTLGDYVEARRIEAACGLLRRGWLNGISLVLK